MPSSVCNSTTSAATFGPSWGAAAPKVSDVCSACRPCTRRRHWGAAAHLDVEPPHEGLNRWQLFLILRRHTSTVTAPPQIARSAEQLPTLTGGDVP